MDEVTLVIDRIILKRDHLWLLEGRALDGRVIWVTAPAPPPEAGPIVDMLLTVPAWSVWDASRQMPFQWSRP